MASKRTVVIKKLSDLQKRLEEQMNFDRYEYMERPEISQIAKGRATAFHAAALLVQLCRQEIEANWPEKAK